MKAFRFFLNKCPELVTSQNTRAETVLHLTCRTGNLEMTKLLLERLEPGQRAQFISVKSTSDGQTCFHIACSCGFLNIVSFLIEQSESTAFIDILDNGANTSLHLAVFHGHGNVVGLLLKYTKLVEARNEESSSTAFELSCRRGFFDISKKLIEQSPVSELGVLLLAACREGADEVVGLLLKKEAPIESVDSGNRNCLEIAISSGHRQVIKTLLNEANWPELVKAANGKVENPQLRGMFEAQMWDIVEVVLDKTLVDVKNQKGFGALDRSVSFLGCFSLYRTDFSNKTKPYS